MFLKTYRLGRVFIHADRFSGMNNREIQVTHIVFCQLLTDRRLIPNQYYPHLIVTCCLYRSKHSFSRGIIASHSIQRYTNGGRHALFPSGSPIVPLTSATSLSRSKGL